MKPQIPTPPWPTLFSLILFCPPHSVNSYMELFQLEVMGNPTQTGLGKRMFTVLCNWRVRNRCGSGHSWFQGSDNVTRVWPLGISPNGSHSQGLCSGVMANVFLAFHSPGSKPSGRDVSLFDSSRCYKKLGESLLSGKKIKKKKSLHFLKDYLKA